MIKKTLWAEVYDNDTSKNLWIPYSVETGLADMSKAVDPADVVGEAGAYLRIFPLQKFNKAILQISNAEIYNWYPKYVLLDLTPWDASQSDQFAMGDADKDLSFEDASFDGSIVAFDPNHDGDYRGRGYFFNMDTGASTLVKAPVEPTVHRAFPMDVTPSGQHILCGHFRDSFTVSFPPTGSTEEWDVEFFENTDYGVFVGTAGNEKFLLREKTAPATGAYSGNHQLIDMTTGNVATLTDPWGDPINGGSLVRRGFNPHTGQAVVGHDDKLWLVNPDGSAQPINVTGFSASGPAIQFDDVNRVWYILSNLTSLGTSITISVYVCAEDFSTYTRYPLDTEGRYVTPTSLIAFVDGDPSDDRCPPFWRSLFGTTESELCPP